MKKQLTICFLLATAFNSIGQNTTYGALAIDKANGFSYGWANDYPTSAEAEQKALEECAYKGGNCTVVLSYSGTGCAAYRTIDGNVGNAYGWGLGNTKEEADRIAIAECLKRSNGKQPTNFVWSCNSIDSGKLTTLKNLVPSANQLFGLKTEDGELYDYEGDITNGLPNGFGVLTYQKSGSTYTGEIRNGIFEGNGVFRFKSGARFEGKFINDKIISGTYFFKNGKKYVGEFSNNEFNGYGKLYDSSGKLIYEGIFKDNGPAN